MQPGPPAHLKLLIQASLLTGFVLLIQAGLIRQYGLTFDESVYIDCQDLIQNWIRNFDAEDWQRNLSAEQLREGWHFSRPDNKNLPLVSIISLLSSNTIGRWDTPLAAGRWGQVIVFSVTCGMIFFQLAKRTSSTAALIAVAAFVGQPRLLTNSSLIAIDPLIASLWIGCSFALIESPRSLPWTMTLGILAGLGFATKPIFWFAYPVWMIWGLLFLRKDFLRPALALALITPVVAYLAVPMWWTNPLQGFLDYLHLLGSEQGWIGVDAYYLGEVYQIEGGSPLPWHAIPLQILVTTPLWILALGLFGFLDSLRRQLLQPEFVLWAAGLLTLPVVFMLPGTPKHDGTRLYLTALYFLPLFVGLGAHRILHTQHLFRNIQQPALLLGLLIPLTIWPHYTVHPAGLSYYNLLVGGLPGATRAGPQSERFTVSDPPLFERTFWWELMTPADWQEMQQQIPPHSKVWVFPDFVGIQRLKKWAIIRDDIEFVRTAEDADYALQYGRLGRLLDPQAAPAGAVFLYEPCLWERSISGIRMAQLLKNLSEEEP